MTQQCWYSQHWRHMYENQVYTRPGLRKEKVPIISYRCMTQQCWYSQHWRHMYENQVYTRPGLRKRESSYYKLQVYDPTMLVQSALASHV